MSEQRISVFMPSEDGEYVPIKFSSPERDLKESEVVIFLDEENKAIYIWTGSSSPVRKRFISSQIARQMRLEKGLTHRISTEDQGNETDRFWEFINRIKGMEIQAKSLLEVSPPVGASDLPLRTSDNEAIEFVDRKKVETMKRISTMSKTTIPDKTEELEEKTLITETITSLTSPTSKLGEKMKPLKLKTSKELYFYVDEVTEVPISKTKMLMKALDQNVVINKIYISTTASEGKISFFKFPKTTSTISCKDEKPFHVIYLKPELQSTIVLNGLKIPIAKGNSIYYSSPANIFISIFLE